MPNPLADNFLIRPLTTELQCAGWGREDASAWVFVNLSDSECVNLQALRRELSEWAREHPGTAYFDIGIAAEPGAFENPTNSMDGWPAVFRHSELVTQAFESLARQAGFENATAHVYGFELSRTSRLSFGDVVGDIQAHLEIDASTEEPATSDGLVAAFPVHTAISRFETGGADCVLRIVPPLSDIEVADAATILPSAVSRLKALNLPPGSKLQLLFATTAVNDDVRAIMTSIWDAAFWRQHAGLELDRMSDNVWRKPVLVSPATGDGI